MNNIDLSSRMNDLKLRACPFPLSTFLTIYTKANHSCYINYMEGAKILYNWLTNNGKIPLDYQLDKHPRIEDITFTVPRLLNGGYEGSELCKILDKKQHRGDWRRTERAIFFTMLGEIEI